MAIHVDSSGLDIDALPRDCITDCSASGDVFEAVEYWRGELAFTVDEAKARAYVLDSGAYDEDELAAKIADDSDFLPRWILWSAACTFSEQLVCMARGQKEGETDSGSSFFSFD